MEDLPKKIVIIDATKLPDPDKLELLARWMDTKDANRQMECGVTQSMEVQWELRQWAKNIREATTLERES
jgi:hypothetical protein